MAQARKGAVFRRRPGHFGAVALATFSLAAWSSCFTAPDMARPLCGKPLVGAATRPGQKATAGPALTRQAMKKVSIPEYKKQQMNDAIRNVLFIAGMAGTIAGSWLVTGKWWKIPFYLAVPSMVYRLWLTRGDTEKLAQVSASVDTKYIASTEEAQKELHMFMCSGCGYTLFPARGREGAFFTDKFKCPMCGASKEEFVDMNDDDDDGSAAVAAQQARKPKDAAPPSSPPAA
eukprot:TRINITY_DN112725_c0_g1_i1.p1 TRINITY_DN112725_c0_g1~~TRINITY_DN112725_c0_g1_i1.p1  ORF type:complete len:232 (+),score=57.08 TRINITY_DN112725_c0_g1_i1:72-767(+)